MFAAGSLESWMLISSFALAAGCEDVVGGETSPIVATVVT